MKKSNALSILFGAMVVAGVAASVVWQHETRELLARYLPSMPAPQETANTQSTAPSPMLAPPTISWVAQPQVAQAGRLAMSFKVDASAPLKVVKILITPVVKLPGVENAKDIVEVPTFSAGKKTLDWDGQLDLTGSTLAGVPVTMQIIAEDSDKREGLSDTVSITLPEHNFSNATAKAIYDLRKALRDDPHNKRLETLRALAGLLQQRDSFENHGLTLLTLRSAAVRIALDKSDDGLHTALVLLWHAAILFEDSGKTSVAISG